MPDKPKPKAMKKVVFLLMILVSLTACKKTKFEPEGPTDVRIKNLSDQNFTDVNVKIKDESIAFGDIAKTGGLSLYYRFQKAYVLADITAKVNGVVFSTDPVNYTYLTYQGQMKITYEVYISDFTNKKIKINNVIPDEPLVLK